jgi:hypothetical protein
LVLNCHRLRVFRCVFFCCASLEVSRIVYPGIDLAAVEKVSPRTQRRRQYALDGPRSCGKSRELAGRSGGVQMEGLGSLLLQSRERFDATRDVYYTDSMIQRNQ